MKLFNKIMNLTPIVPIWFGAFSSYCRTTVDPSKTPNSFPNGVVQ